MFALPRKDNTLLGWVHVLSGAGAFATSLWALALVTHGVQGRTMRGGMCRANALVRARLDLLFRLMQVRSQL